MLTLKQAKQLIIEELIAKFHKEILEAARDLIEECNQWPQPNSSLTASCERH